MELEYSTAFTIIPPAAGPKRGLPLETGEGDCAKVDQGFLSLGLLFGVVGFWAEGSV